MTNKASLVFAMFFFLLAPLALSCGAGLETSRADELESRDHPRIGKGRLSAVRATLLPEI